MPNRWQVNSTSGPRVIGGVLLGPGEGTFVDDGPLSFPSAPVDATALGATAAAVNALFALGTPVAAGVVLVDPTTGQIYGQSDGLGGYSPIGGADPDSGVTITKRGGLAAALVVGTDTIILPTTLGGSNTPVSTVGTGSENLASFVLPANAGQANDRIQLELRWTYPASVNSKQFRIGINGSNSASLETVSSGTALVSSGRADILINADLTATVLYPFTQIKSSAAGSYALPSGGGALNLAVDNTFTLAYQASTGGESVTLTFWRATLMRAA